MKPLSEMDKINVRAWSIGYANETLKNNSPTPEMVLDAAKKYAGFIEGKSGDVVTLSLAEPQPKENI